MRGGNASAGHSGGYLLLTLIGEESGLFLKRETYILLKKSGYEKHKLALFLPRTVQIMSLYLFKSSFHYVAFLLPPAPPLVLRRSDRAGPQTL